MANQRLQDIISKYKSSKAEDKIKKLLLLSLCAGIGFTVAMFASSSFTIWLFVILLLWWYIIMGFWQGVVKGGKVFAGNYMAYFVMAVVVSLLIFINTKPTDTSDTDTKTVTGESSVTASTQSQVDNTQYEIYDCKYTASNSLKAYSKYKIRLFSSANVDSEVGKTRSETDTSTYYLRDFVLGGKEPAETVFFTVDSKSGGFMPGVSILMQVCNTSTNKSTAFTALNDYYVTPTSSNTSGVEIEMSPIDVPKKTGSYRIDGLMKVNDGAWQLVARKNVQFK